MGNDKEKDVEELKKEQQPQQNDEENVDDKELDSVAGGNLCGVTDKNRIDD